MYSTVEWPPHTVVFDFKIDNGDPELEPSLTKLTEETIRYLGELGMPESMELGFEPQSNQRYTPTAQSDELSFAVESYEDEGSILYTVKSRVEEQNYVDHADYLLWRPQREGFMLPWGISVQGLSRTVHPARRQRRFNLEQPEFTPKSPLQSTANVLNAVRRGVYRLHLPVVRQVNGEYQ